MHRKSCTNFVPFVVIYDPIHIALKGRKPYKIRLFDALEEMYKTDLFLFVYI